MDISAIAATITALGVIFGAVFAVYKWFLKQEKQGCNGPVTDAIDRIETYLNQRTHR